MRLGYERHDGHVWKVESERERCGVNARGAIDARFEGCVRGSGDGTSAGAWGGHEVLAARARPMQASHLTTNESLGPKVSWEERYAAGVWAALAAKLGRLRLVRRRRGAGCVIGQEAVQGADVCSPGTTTERGQRRTMLVRSCLCSAIPPKQTSAYRMTHPTTGCCTEPCGDRAGLWPGRRHDAFAFPLTGRQTSNAVSVARAALVRR
jgi:hypothetical protein